MGYVSPNRLGLSVAVVLGAWHAVWALLVAGGVAQRVIDFAYALHALKTGAVVGPFDPLQASLLVLVTAVLGYLTGAAAGITWNCVEHWCRPAGTCVSAGASSTPPARRAA